MTTKTIDDLIARQVPPLAFALEQAQSISVSGVQASGVAVLAAGLRRKRPLVCVMDDLDEAGYLYSDLEQMLGEESVMLFPSAYRRAIRYGHRDAAQALSRSMALSRLMTAQSDHEPLPIIVTYPEALAELVVDEQAISEEHLILHRGATIERSQLIDRLLGWDYERVDYVYEPGQFAIRGSIFDIYSYASERPYRLDFWDDELDSLRTFEIESQLSIATMERATVVPDLGLGSKAGATLLELMPEDTLIYARHLSYVKETISRVWTEEPRIHDGEGFDTLAEIQALLSSPERLERGLEALASVELQTTEADTTVSLRLMALPLFGKDYERLSQQIADWYAEDYAVYVCSRQSEPYERLCTILAEHRRGLTPPDRLSITLHEGFVDDLHREVYLTEHQIFGRYHKYSLQSDKVRSGKTTLSLKELNTFSPGDLVVHSDHGVGKFWGLATITVGDRRQEVVKIEYNKGDSIYVSLHNLHKLSPYRQKESAEGVKLSSLGSGAWHRLKEKTKTQIKDMARRLIRLYSQRREIEGFAYSPDSYLQYELEASFPYDPTPDQLKATADIKADMERPYPMDRLLCGDVGFGKTEVAIRAAFKAASDSKQVAVLVPTTVLAYQHYRTFRARLEGFPVRVEYISRGRTSAEIKRILQDLREGQIDIIIGTHRLTSKDVKFKDLGLLIVDEEQKFGVSAKEKLRELQAQVDTLTMSATPIPRTLQFSLMGARDLSNINTPPPNRIPIETIRTVFSAEQMAEAINFEMSRNGQVFLIHNRVQNIAELAALVQRHVPDARIAVGHGQLTPTELERILIDFGRHDYDVLIATTIIENGIDVPNANTIIINDAHRFGLSELHQLRGRVGRSDRKAFCYLMTPPLETLTPEASRRVRAIENFSDLGSGVRIALQDLDIRGAGNALGAEQSGFIMDMGYETYQKVFNEAVRELKAEEFSDVFASGDEQKATAEQFVAETQVDSDLPLALPLEYVPSDSERILLYRELDGLSTDEELKDYRSRLVDRFGEPPLVVDELIVVPRLRHLGMRLGMEKIVLRQDLMILYPPSQLSSPYYKSSMVDILLGFVQRNSKRCEIHRKGDRYTFRIKSVESVSVAIAICLEILGEGQ